MHFNTDLLLLARESRGYSQTELAKRAGMTQETVSRYENNSLAVAEENARKLAGALNYPLEFFSQDARVYGAGITFETYFRKRTSVGSLHLRKVQAQMEVLRLRLDRLLRNIELESEFNFDAMDIDEYDGDVERIAGLLRAAWKLPPGPVKNLVGVIERAGGLVIHFGFGTPKIDAASQWVRGMPPLFFVNSSAPGDRQRLTLSHELGHVLMHRTMSANVEEEADRFASSFLMPAHDILPELRSRPRLTLDLLANLKVRWRVSMQALVRRARDLGVITENEYRNLFIEFSRRGWRKHEPVEVQHEEPKLLAEVLTTVLKTSFADVGDLAKALLADEEDLRQQFPLGPTRLRVLSNTRNTGDSRG
ncbi:MAG: hypothetical protein BroJett014_04480 [Planctomycetota bacterium]|nr:MAG: hypothetical protein BroJett014_04480 [Planctomycetota bacterium]